MVMTKLVFGSDIHLEFGPITHLTNEHNADILILAGDISTPHAWKHNHDSHSRKGKDRQLSFFRDMSTLFPTVIYIPGNHEHYQGDYNSTETILQTELAKFGNIKVGNHVVHEEQDFVIIANTLWTDFDKANPQSFVYANVGMNDFRIVSKGRDYFRAEDAYEIHKEALKMIEQDMQKATEAGKKIVMVSHHLPSFQVIAPAFRDSRLNGAYASSLEWLMEKYNPVVWIHGHSHPPVDLMIGQTRLLRNPRGYVNHEHSEKEDLNYKLQLIEI